MRVFSTHPDGNQSNCHKLVLEGRMQEVSGLIRTAISWYNRINSINNILQSKTVIIKEIDEQSKIIFRISNYLWDS